MSVTKNLQGNKLEVWPPMKLVFYMSLPMIISQMVKALYNTVDSYFVSCLSMDEMAAITLAYSAQSIMNSLAMGLAVGLTSALAYSLGRRDEAFGWRLIGNGMLCALVITLGCMLFSWLGVEWYYRAMGAQGRILELGCSYLKICMLISIGIAFPVIFESMLQATGHTVASMIVQGSCFGLNVILDPILIFGLFGAPAMGIAGAAVATVISQCVGVVVGLILNLHFNRHLFPSITDILPHKNALGKIFKVGFPSGMLNLLVPIMTLGINSILIDYSSEYVALFGIYFRLQLFMFCSIFGVNNGVIPVIGYNLGAKKPQRVIGATKAGIFMALVISVVGFVCFHFFGGSLLRLFHATDAMMDLGIRAFKIISLTFPMAACSVCMSGVFQGLGNGVVGLVISVIRQLFVVLVAMIIVKIFGLYNIWYAYVVSETVAIIVCAGCCFRLPYILKKEMEKR